MSQPVGRPGQEPTSHSTQPPASLPLGVDRQLGRKRLRITEALPQEPLACQPPPSPTSVVWGSLTPSPGEEASGFSWKQEEESCLLRLTQLGMRGVSHKATSAPAPAAEVLGGLNMADILGAPFTGDVVKK